MRSLVPVALILAFAVPAYPSARLTYDIGGAPVPVAWPASALPIQYTIDQRVADSIPGNAASVDSAFAAWTVGADTSLTFRSLGVATGVKAGHDGKSTVTMVDDLFKDQKFVALTTNWYDSSGVMSEADIQIDPSAVADSYNLKLLIEHEVGHLLGLDHSAVISSVMYPYVGRAGATVLDSDDRLAIGAVYPKPETESTGSTLQGEVRGDQGGIFAAQVVALNQRGEPVSTGLTNARGDFELRGVPEGDYRLYAEPLDGPVDENNLSGIWRDAQVTSFPTHFMAGGPLHVDAGKVYGSLIIDSAGTPVTLNPEWIGVAPAGSASLSLSSTPISVRVGDSVQIAVAGDGFTSGMTTFEVLSPGVRRTSDFKWSANYVYATFSVGPDVPGGSAIILVHSGNDTAALTGGLLIEGKARTRIVRR